MMNEANNRFFKKITRVKTMGFVEPCWIWNGAKDSKGFGRFSVNSENKLAHSYAYETFIGIPKEYLQNTCGKKNCVNPKHWEEKKNVGRTREVSPDIILELRSSGKSVADIAAQLNCSKSLVYKILAHDEKP